jgi:hypothetical protein
MAVTVIFWFYSGVTTILKKNHFVSYHHHLSELLPSLSNFRKQISKQPSSISWRDYKGSLKTCLSKGQLSNFSYTYVWTEKIRKIDLTCFYTRHVGIVVISVTINHFYSHKPYTTVQKRHKYTYNKYRIDINIYTVYTTKTWVWDSLKNNRFIYISYKFTWFF